MTRYRNNPLDYNQCRSIFCILPPEDWSFGLLWGPDRDKTCLTSKKLSYTSDSTRFSGRIFTTSVNRTFGLAHSPVVGTPGLHPYYDNPRWSSHCTHRSDTPYRLSPSSSAKEVRHRHKTSFHPLCACTFDNNTYIACESVHLVSYEIESVLRMSGHCSWWIDSYNYKLRCSLHTNKRTIISVKTRLSLREERG